MGILRSINDYSRPLGHCIRGPCDRNRDPRVGACDGQPDIRRPFSSKLETSKLANETLKGNLIVRCHRYCPGELRLP
ncbi:hypothetical protein EV363DRAFT_1231603 [Boletus edulis]|nr:hypothetical protein EV363DRAFT_1231603 [Boletus edulis]